LIESLVVADNNDFSVIRAFDNVNMSAGIASGVAVDDVDGSIYFWGQRTAAFLTKMAANGSILWTSSFYGNQSAAGPNPIIDSSTRDVFVAGTAQSSFDSQSVEQNLDSSSLVFQLGSDFSTCLWIPEWNAFVATWRFQTSSENIYQQAYSSFDGLTWVLRGNAAYHGETILRRFKAAAWSPTLQTIALINANNELMTGSNMDVLATWRYRTVPAQDWQSIAWSDTLQMFVAVARSGSGNRVMRSTNGTVWISGKSAADSDWSSVIWAGGNAAKFLAISSTGVMISANGIDWTAYELGGRQSWTSVCYSAELNLFVAVARSGNGNRAMTSTDGISWFLRATPADSNWQSVIWAASGLNMFVAVANSGAVTERLMTSSDGINWFLRPLLVSMDFTGVAWSPVAKVLVLNSPQGMQTIKGTFSTIFVSRLSSANGTRFWTKFYGGPAGSRAYSMVQTASSLIIGGSSVGAVGGQPAIGGDDCLLISINKNSTAVEWTQLFGTSGVDGIFGITISEGQSSVIYTTGSTTGRLGLASMNNGGSDVFVTKHSVNNGNLISAVQFGSSADDSGLSIAADANGTVLYLVGYAGGSIMSKSLVSTGEDQMVAALSTSSLNLIWIGFIGGIGFNDRATSLALHPSTGVVYVGGFINAALANSGLNVQSTSYGNFDLTLSAIHPKGCLLWSRVGGSGLNDQAGNLAFNKNGVLFMAARINGSNGYLVHTLDATGNTSFNQPVTSVGATSFSGSCNGSAWAVIYNNTVSTATTSASASVTTTATSLLPTVTEVDRGASNFISSIFSNSSSQMAFFISFCVLIFVVLMLSAGLALFYNRARKMKRYNESVRTPKLANNLSFVTQPFTTLSQHQNNVQSYLFTQTGGADSNSFN
jgi:hypothetical protein